jgi:hypothetical protein
MSRVSETHQVGIIRLGETEIEHRGVVGAQFNSYNEAGAAVV